MSWQRIHQWMRMHPVRSTVYALLVAGLASGVAASLAVLAGWGDGLLTRIAHSAALQERVQRSLRVQYTVKSVHVGLNRSECGLSISVSGAGAELIDVGASVQTDQAQICWPSSALASGVRLGTVEQPDLLSLASASISRAREFRLVTVEWNDSNGGALLTVDRATTNLVTFQSEVSGIRVLPGGTAPLAEVEQASSGALHLSGNAARLDSAEARNVSLFLEQGLDARWNVQYGLARITAAAQTASNVARRSLATLSRVASRVGLLLLYLAVFSCAAVFLIKLPITHSPRALPWRLVVAGAPVGLSVALRWLLFGAVSLRAFAVVSIFGVISIAVVLQVWLYRRAKEWHQRWEPAVADVVAPLLILPLLVGCGYSSFGSFKRPPDVSFSLMASKVDNVLTRIRVDPCGLTDLAQLRVRQAGVENLHLALDSVQLALRTLEVERAFAQGEAQSSLSGELQKLHYLPTSWRQASGVPFCITSAVRSGAADPSLVPGCDPGRGFPTVAVTAVVNPDLANQTATVSATVRTAPAALHLEANGDLKNGVHITVLRSLPDSTLRVGNGAGLIALTHNIGAHFHLNDLGISTPASTLSILSLDLSGHIPPACSSGKTSLRARLSGMKIASTGYALAVKEADFQTIRAPADLRLDAQLLGMQIEGYRPHDRDIWLNMDLPSVTLRFGGQTTGELLPRKLQGQVNMSIARGGGEPAFRLSKPLTFSADLWRGVATVPEQSVTIEQSVVSRLPHSILLRLSTDAQVESLDVPVKTAIQARVQVPQVTFEDLPVGIELHDVSADGRWRTPGPMLELAYRSGWNRITLPTLEGSIAASRISRLDVGTEGHADRFPEGATLSNDLTMLRTWVERLPTAVGRQLAFRFEGSDGTMKVTTQSDASIHVGQVKSQIRALRLPSAHLALAEAECTANIGAGGGSPSLELAFASTITDGQLDTVITQPVAAVVHASARGSEVELSHEVVVDPLLEKLKPLFRELGLDAEGIRIPARITRLKAATNIAQGELKGFALEANLAEGDLAAVDFAKLLRPGQPSFLQTLQASQSSPSTLAIMALAASWPRIDVTASAPALKINVNGGSIETALSARAETQLSLATGPAEEHRILNRVWAAATALQHQVGDAMSLFPRRSSGLEDVSWSLELHGGDRPLFVSAVDRIDLALQAKINELRWRSTGLPLDSRVSGTLDLAALLTEYDNHLLIDSYPALDFSFSSAGASPRKFAIRVPLLAAVSDRLRPASAKSEELFDSQYYENLWRDYRPVYAASGPSWFNQDELDLPQLSLLQIRIPGDPIRLAVGYGTPFEINVPLRARILFGDLDGLLQAAVTRKGDGALVDSHGYFAFRDLQAGAVRISTPNGYLPYLEDSLDGALTTRTDGLLIQHSLLPILLSDASQATELDRLSFNLTLHSRPSNPPLPGMLQANTNLEVKLYNQLAEAILQNLHFQLPPQAIRYHDLALAMQVVNGEVQTRPALLNLRGVQTADMIKMGLSVGVSVHWGSRPWDLPAETFRLRTLIYFLQRALATQAPR